MENAGIPVVMPDAFIIGLMSFSSSPGVLVSLLGSSMLSALTVSLNVFKFEVDFIFLLFKVDEADDAVRNRGTLMKPLSGAIRNAGLCKPSLHSS